MSSEILRMDGITKIYNNGFIALEDVTLTVNKGEIHGLIGENGAGKTTLMKVLFGAEKPLKGKIIIDGEEVHIKNPLDAIDKGIGMVHQHFMQVPNLTVAENIILGVEPTKAGGLVFNSKKAVSMVTEASEKYKLNVDPNVMVADIGVGLKQKVEILKALIRGVKILILDEPTAVLTPQETQELFEQLKYLRELGFAVIFISHKLDEVMELCDRVTVLRHGRVVGHGDTKELDEIRLSKMIVGRDVITTIDKPENEVGDIVVKINELEYFDEFGKCRLDRLSFGIHAGEIVGIAGVEGNGQNELSELLAGLKSPSSGTIEINGKNTSGMSVKQIRKLGVSYISEDRMKYGCAQELPIRENIASIYLEDGNFRKGPFLDVRKLTAFTDQCIKDFEIAAPSSSTPVRMLSGGNIQKVIVAREFTCGSNFYIVNQPTRGIDVGTSDLIRRLLIKYARESKVAVLLVTSDLNEVLEVSDRLLVMRNGKLAAQFTDVKGVRDEVLGEYMLGVRTMSSDEMGDLF